jgi:hypothetical protein
VWFPWGETPLNEEEGYRPWVRDPKALEEDPGMGWKTEQLSGQLGETPIDDSNVYRAVTYPIG